MKFKDHMPIKFEFLQSDIEHFMFFTDRVIKSHRIEEDIRQFFIKFKDDLQNKIDIHTEEGEWV